MTGSSSAVPPSYFAYVGAYTTKERAARGNGLNVYRVDAKTAAWTHVQLLADLVNPSFLALDRTQRFLYAVHGDLSDVSAFAIDSATGRLTFLNRQSTEGKNPVHLTLDAGNRFVVLANHITSTVALVPRRDDGRLDPVADLVKLEGKIGPHRVEQQFAKPHQVELDPSGRFIVAPDKGLDCLFVYRVDAAAKKLVRVGEPVPARAGAGPRHIAFHPGGRLAYVINELDSTVTAYRFDPASGALMPFQLLSSLPDDFTANNTGSEIAVSPDGQFLYVSNRGHDSIGVFAIEAATGRLSAVAWHPTLGKTPRFFALDPTEAFLFAANEGSDTIVVFARDRRSGRLSPTQTTIKIGSPACIAFKTA